MRRLVLIAVVIVLVGVGMAAAFTFFRKQPVGQETGGSLSEGTGGNLQPQPLGQYPGVPVGETFTIGTAEGILTVKNFYKSAVAIVEDTDVVLKETRDYSIHYSRADSSFQVIIMNKPTAAARSAAEKDLLSILGVQLADACSLKVVVIVPLPVDQASAGSFRLSFCPSAS